METQKIELVSPTVVDDIELYISADGRESGMSISGLARFISVPRKTLSDFLTKLDNEAGDKDVCDTLKTIKNKVFTLAVSSTNGAKIVRGDAIEAIVFYEMTEKNNEIAKFSYRKFAQKGIHQWIKETVGFIEQHNNIEVLSMFKQVMASIDELKDISKKYTAIREKTTTIMPGANDLLNKLEEPTDNLLPPESGRFPDGKMSLEAWLFYEKKGMSLSKYMFRRLANIVAETYRSLVKEDPEKRHCVVDGRKKYNVSVYAPSQFPILQICLNKVIND